MNKWSLTCSTFLGSINLLHFTPLSVRIHLISLSYHILVILPSHFSSMEQILMLMLRYKLVEGERARKASFASLKSIRSHYATLVIGMTLEQTPPELSVL